MPTTPPFSSSVRINPFAASCNTELTRILAPERYPQLGQAAVPLPQDLRDAISNLQVEFPYMNKDSAEKLQNCGKELDAFLFSSAPDWQKFQVLAQRLSAAVGSVVNQFPRIPHLIYGDYLIHLLQSLQRPEFIQLIVQGYNYRDTITHHPQAAIELEKAATVLGITKRLYALNSEILLLEQALKMLLKTDNDVRVVGEAALLVSTIFKNSEFYGPRKALPIDEFHQRSPAKLKSLQGSASLDSIRRAQRRPPGVVKLLEETLRPLLLDPATDPIISLYFFQEEPHYFGFIMEDHARSMVGKIGGWLKKSKEPTSYYLSVKNFLESEHQSGKPGKSSKRLDEDLPVGVFIPDTGGYLHPSPPNLMAVFYLQQGDRKHVYLSSVAGSWARSFLLQLLAEYKQGRFYGDIFLSEILKFQLLPAVAVAKGTFPSLQDLPNRQTGPELLRSLLHISEQRVSREQPPMLTEIAQESGPAINVKYLLPPTPGDFNPEEFRQRIVAIEQWEQTGTLSKDDNFKKIGEFSQLALELNQQSDQLHRAVVEIYREMMDAHTGIIHIANLSSASAQGSWKKKAALINGYDFASRLQRLSEVDQSYVDLLELRIHLEGVNNGMTIPNTYHHFLELLELRGALVQELMKALLEVQLIFSVTPSQYAGKNSSLNFSMQADRLLQIQLKLLGMSPD